MDRLKITLGTAEYVLPLVDMGSVNLGNWTERVSGDNKYYANGAGAAMDTQTITGQVDLPYGTYHLTLENGIYCEIDKHPDPNDPDSDYITIGGLYDENGSVIGGYTGMNYGYVPHDQSQVFAIFTAYQGEIYIGFAFWIYNTVGACQIPFLCNDYMIDPSMVDPYTGDTFDPTPGGWGSWDRSTDGVGANPTPSTLAPFNAGVNMYTLNASALKSFTGFLWGSDESIFAALWSRYTNYIYNPIGALIACHCLPTEFTPSGTSTTVIHLAGTAIFPISGTLKTANTQFIDQTYSISLAEFYGDFMDYTSTRLILHLPFCGVCVLDPVYVVGGGLNVLYRCDVCTGNVSAFIICTNRFGRSELIQVTGGNCAYTTPLTGHSDGMLEAIGNASKMIAGGVATALTGVPMSTGSAESPLMQKESTTIAGAFSGSAAITSSLDLYIEIVYTEPSDPAGYTHLRGRPADIGGTVGSFTGYTVFSDVHADGVYRATDEEKRMIEQQLKGGVIV